VLNYRGYSQLRGGDQELAVNSLEKAREAYRSVDNLTFVDLPSAAGYAEATAWQMDAIRGLGRNEEAKRRGEEGAQVATKVLEQRPAYMGALRARALIYGNLTELEADALHLNRALVLGSAATRDWEDYLKLDPGNVVAWNNLAGGHQRDGFVIFRLGRLNEGRDKLLAAAGVEQRTRMSAFFAVNQIFAWGPLAQLEAERGNQPQAEAALAQVHRLARIAGEGRQEPYAKASLKMLETGFQIAIPVANYDFQSARRMLVEAIPDASVVKPSGGQMEWIWNVNLEGTYRNLAFAEYNLKDYTDAEKAIRLGMTYQKRVPERTLERLREEALNQIILAATLARLDRRPEAQQALAPALKFYGERQARSSEDLLLRIEFAQALYASSLAAQDAGALAEAAAIIDGLPATMRNLKSTIYIRKLIADEQASPRK
jgi:tetratricopeptide (TPR) repeat protein